MRKILVIFAVLASLLGGVLVAQPVAAAPGDEAICQDFLTFPSWCRGLVDSSGTELKQPAVGEGGNAGAEEMPMGEFVGKIIGNVIEILLQLVGYASIIMIIYGGIKYLTANGNASKIQDGTSMITRAMIGVVLGVLGSGIVGAVVTVSDAAGGDEKALYNGLIGRAATVLGIVAVVFALYGAFTIVTSHGNPTRLAKGKQTVIWSCIGLAVIILAAVIFNAVLTGATEGIVR